jgi:hypothetical protein
MKKETTKNIISVLVLLFIVFLIIMGAILGIIIYVSGESHI